MKPYSKQFYSRQSPASKQSADIVLAEVVRIIGPVTSVIDLGCGLGTWLSFFYEQGASVLGIDGDYVDRSSLFIPADKFISLDLSTGDFSCLKGRYDLAISLEVAEHIPESVAESFIAKLCSLSDVVLFSAAIPLQNGTNHVNCQWQGYWGRKFFSNGFIGMDTIRKRLWYERLVKYHYRQNMLLYVRQNTTLYEKLKSDAYFLYDVVHPNVYLRSQQDATYNKNKRFNIRIKNWVKRLRRLSGGIVSGDFTERHYAPERGKFTTGAIISSDTENVNE